MPELLLENILKRDRFIIISGILLITILAWTYIIYLYQQMNSMNMESLFLAMPMNSEWTATDFALMFLMWSVMMIAMMMPSAAPLILIFAMVNRNREPQQQPLVPTAYFLLGYLLVWMGFSLVATSLQWYLQYLDLLSPEMKTTNHLLGGIILTAAGIFQFTPLKKTCLTHCRTPVDFIHHHWKEKTGGVIQMGITHGIYCLGCCWILMALLFVAGIMNLLWVVLIALFILVEKVFPSQKLITALGGITLIVLGIIDWMNA